MLLSGRTYMARRKKSLAVHDVAVVPFGSCEQLNVPLWHNQCIIVFLRITWISGTITLSPHTLEQLAYEATFNS